MQNSFLIKWKKQKARVVEKDGLLINCDFPSEHTKKYCFLFGFCYLFILWTRVILWMEFYLLRRVNGVKRAKSFLCEKEFPDFRRLGNMESCRYHSHPQILFYLFYFVLQKDRMSFKSLWEKLTSFNHT